MKKRLRLLAWMLTLTMLCELLPFGAFAQSDVGQQLALAAAQSLEEENGEAVASGSCGSYVKWSLSGDGTLTIYGRGAIYNYHPNENLCNLPPWWDYRESINTIILDSEISRIGDAAFYGCNIASIDIPDNIHSIGKWAFSYCTRLSSVTIPDGMTSIAWSAFSNTALTSFTIPESVTSIDGYAFSNCPLSSITIPDNVTCNGVQREHNKKLNNGLPILHKVPPKRDYGRYFCIMAEKGGTSHGGLTEKLSPFFHAKKQEVNAYGR